jgi:hypothetical protein
MPQPCGAKKQRRDQQQKHVRRQDADCPALIELTNVTAKRLLPVIKENACNKKAGENKEEVNSHPKKLDLKGVVHEDAGHRQGSNAIELGDAAAAS